MPTAGEGRPRQRPSVGCSGRNAFHGRVSFQFRQGFVLSLAGRGGWRCRQRLRVYVDDDDYFLVDTLPGASCGDDEEEQLRLEEEAARSASTAEREAAERERKGRNAAKPPPQILSSTASRLQGAAEYTTSVVSETAERLSGEWDMNASMNEAAKQCVEERWKQVMTAWERPALKRFRVAFNMVNIGFRLPALAALVFAQVTMLASQVSLPMLAPLLLGTGILLRSIQANASVIFPRIGVLVVLLWILWFANSVVRSTVLYLQRQVRKCAGVPHASAEEARGCPG